MTVSTSDSRKQYTGDGVTDSFSFPYRLLAASHLKVYEDDTLLTLTTDYTVTIAGDGNSATVDTTSPVGSGVVLTIDRVVPATQETDYPEGDPFPAESHEAALDKLTLLVQQINKTIQGIPRLPPYDTSGADLTFPTPVALAVWSFNSDGTAVVFRELGDVELAVPGDLSVTTGKIVDLAVTTAKLAADCVTFAKMQNISTNTLLGRSTAGTGDVEEITCTAAGRALLDDADASAQRTTLGIDATLVTGLVSNASETVAGKIEIATDAEAQAFTASRAIDGAKLNTALKGSNQSLATDGYQKYPGGFIEQWGVSGAASLGVVSVTFPTPFPNACLNVIPVIYDASDAGGYSVSPSLRSKTTSGAEFGIDNGSVIHWRAIGY